MEVLRIFVEGMALHLFLAGAAPVLLSKGMGKYLELWDRTDSFRLAWSMWLIMNVVGPALVYVATVAQDYAMIRALLAGWLVVIVPTFLMAASFTFRIKRHEQEIKRLLQERWQEPKTERDAPGAAGSAEGKGVRP